MSASNAFPSSTNSPTLSESTVSALDNPCKSPACTAGRDGFLKTSTGFALTVLLPTPFLPMPFIFAAAFFKTSLFFGAAFFLDTFFVTFFLAGFLLLAAVFLSAVFLSFVCFFLVFLLVIRAVYHRQTRAHKTKPHAYTLVQKFTEKFDALQGVKRVGCVLIWMVRKG